MSTAFPGRINLGGAGIPVAVAMHVRLPGTRLADWRLSGILSGGAFGGERQRQLLREDEHGRHLLFRGLRLRLDPLRAADYVLNLNNQVPRLFVVLRFDADTGAEPLQVTASLDEAQALDTTELRDADEHVVSVPMPPEVGVQVAEFTRTHYRPPERKGRRRREGRGGD